MQSTLLPANTGNSALADSPLAIWVETILGVSRASETDPKLVRAMPRTLQQASEELPVTTAFGLPEPSQFPALHTFDDVLKVNAT